MSSLGHVPLTDETRAALLAAGVEPDSADGLSEMGGQHLLAVRSHVVDGGYRMPSCFQAKYSPTNRLCGGCPAMPKCWVGCGSYLRRLAAGEVGAPPGVPAQVVAERLAEPFPEVKAPPAPPAPAPAVTRPAPPPPPAATPAPRPAPPPPPRAPGAPPVATAPEAAPPAPVAAPAPVRPQVGPPTAPPARALPPPPPRR